MEINGAVSETTLAFFILHQVAQELWCYTLLISSFMPGDNVTVLSHPLS